MINRSEVTQDSPTQNPVVDIRHLSVMHDGALRRKASARMRMLGERAAARRVSLSMKRPELVRKLGITPNKLLAIERSVPPDADPLLEEMWEDALFVPRGWLRDENIAFSKTENAMSGLCDLSHCKTAADEIRAISAWLAKASRVKRSFAAYPLNKNERRSAEIFALRYGVNGESESTLQSIGDRYKITRERVRQLAAMLSSRASDLAVATPFIDAALVGYRPLLPARLADIDTALRQTLGDGISITGVSRFAREILGREGIDFSRHPSAAFGGSETVFLDDYSRDKPLISSLRSCAMRMIRHTGAANTSVMVGAISADMGRQISAEEIIGLYQTLPHFEWLIEDDGWFWLGQKMDNRLVSVAKKMLSTAGGPVDSSDLSFALAKSRRDNSEEKKVRNYAIEPPVTVVTEVLKRHGDFRVFQHVFVDLQKPIDPATLLSDAEKCVYDIMVARGNVTSRAHLIETLVDTARIKAVTLHVAIASSPVFRRIERGVFALVGRRISSEWLNTAQGEVGDGVERKRIDYQATPENPFFSTTIQISNNAIHSGFITPPAAMAKVLEEGSYVIEGANKVIHCGIGKRNTLRINNLPEWLLDNGFAPGESFLFGVNPDAKTIRIQKQ